MVEWRSDGLLVPSAESLRSVPGYVVDSAFPPEEALRRFRSTVAGDAPTALSGGERSLDALLRRYWALLVARDTVSMSNLVLNRGEFAYLYFPDSPELAAGLAPEVTWLLIASQGGRGLTRALRAAESAQTKGVARTICLGKPRALGRNTAVGPCGVVLAGPSADTVWIAKAIIQRDGVHKLLGLSNDL
jgi:hypothetical protein